MKEQSSSQPKRHHPYATRQNRVASSSSSSSSPHSTTTALSSAQGDASSPITSKPYLDASAPHDSPCAIRERTPTETQIRIRAEFNEERAAQAAAELNRSPNTSLPQIADTEEAPDPGDPPLSVQQQAALDKVLKGESLFFTGSAGTGKSFLLRAITVALRQKLLQGELAVTASTGIAALNIGGRTLHSWSGIGHGKGDVEKLINMIQRCPQYRDAWLAVKVLVIDEISMISGALFEKLEQIGRAVRGNNRPFGGIQIIASGDFFQLPPVDDRDETIPTKFAFEAKSWNRVIHCKNIVTLDVVYRQRDDRFVMLLERMRKGRLMEEDEQLLQTLDRPLVYADGINPVGLYPTRREVDAINMSELAKLPGAPRFYIASDHAGEDSRGYRLTPKQATKLLNARVTWPAEISLKIGAMVLLCHQDDLVNGSQGKVVGFSNIPDALAAGVQITMLSAMWASSQTELWPVIEFTPVPHAGIHHVRRFIIPDLTTVIENANDGVEAVRRQVPLLLAWYGDAL
ncbi:ATP-dependent DNA helicase PIF1, partial [Tremellales sp. Uapishka_1]